jgi:hypothetical protein
MRIERAREAACPYFALKRMVETAKVKQSPGNYCAIRRIQQEDDRLG